MISRFVMFIAATLLFVDASAQTAKTTDHQANDSNYVEQKDIRDFAKKLFATHHGPTLPSLQPDSTIEINPLTHPVLEQDSTKIKSGKLLFAAIPAIGITIQTGVTAILATNISFYTGKMSNTNISSIALNPAVSLDHNQFLLPAVFNIWSPRNKLNFVGDWRYYIYPTYTYGLGGNSKTSNADLIDYNYGRIYQQVSKNITSHLYAGAGYNLDYHWGIKEEGNESYFQDYNNNAKRTVSSGLSVDMIYDGRKNINNPENAFYGGVTYRSNFTFLGSDQNWQSLYIEFKKYINLPGNSHNVLAFWNLNWFAFGGKPPYFDLPSTGWDSYSNTGRGYIQGRLRGPGMIYLETEYRYRITKNGLLGGVVFANAESVSDFGNNKFQTVLPGYGFGIRIKANKKSNVNLAIDYGLAIDGSGGFAFNVSEVF